MPERRKYAEAVLLVAFAVRLAAVLVSARVFVDVLRYHKVAEHVLDVSWNPYEAPRLYPYPPLWVWFEAGAGWLERQGASFAIVIKMAVVLADVALVALLLRWSGRAAWLYALHPVSILVTGFHGQFDALMLLFLVAAVQAYEAGAYDRSALGLSAAIATKSLPIVLLPFFLFGPAPLSPARRLRFAALAVVPVLLMLAPYVVHNAAAVQRELFAYGGIADFGWIGLYRGVHFLESGRLLPSRPEVWGLLVPAAKVLFLAALGTILLLERRRPRLDVGSAALAVLLAFLVFYGSVSAQYLLWPVALGARRAGLPFFAYGVAATAALLGFYAFLAPGVLFADAVARETAGLWVAGVGAVLLASAWWLVTLLRPAPVR